MESKRKLKRIDMPVGVKFRPTYGATEYSLGITMDLSCEGMGLNAPDFRFFVYENLELIVDTPGNEDPVHLIGDVLWKRQTGKRCLAGIKFKIENEDLQKENMAKIMSSTNILIDDIYSVDDDYTVSEKAGRSRVSDTSGPDIVLSDLPNKLGIIKHYHANGRKCRVTFRLLREMAKDTESVAIVGDFNDWDSNRSQMTRLDNGDFVITMELDNSAEYRFRYLMDGHRWENDWHADKFVPNDHGSKDSVAIV
ncbi:MAG: PilZ domain-containing protein [Nitrospirota bacterium]